MDLFCLFEQEITRASKNHELPPFLLFPLYSIARNKKRYIYQEKQVLTLLRLVHEYREQAPNNARRTQEKEILHLVNDII